MPTTRREFLSRSAALAASGALVGVSGCDQRSPEINATPGDNGIPDNRSEVFPHGVASGDPLTDRVMLWTRVTAPQGITSVSGTVRVYRDPALQQLHSQRSFVTDASRDFTVKLDFDGLLPGQAWYYQFTALGEQSPIGRARTIPTQTDRARFVACTCGDYSRGLWNAYARIAQRNDLDAVIHLGDYIYETDRDRVRAHQPPQDVWELDHYRARYASYRIEPELQELHRQHPMIWVWDDHETVDGAWMNGADPNDHIPELHGDYQDRKAAALQAALEWLPIRSVDPGNPERIYRQFAWGDLLDLLMLDTRRIGRDQQGEGTVDGDFFRQTDAPFNDASRTILGSEQTSWLEDELTRSQQRDARWRLIGNQVVFSQIKVVGAPDDAGAVYANPDQWDGYKGSRERLLDTIENGAIDNVVFLTGDVHASMVYEASRDPHGGLYTPGTGIGSFATEFVTPSISSAGDVVTDPSRPDNTADGVLLIGADALRANNPHMRYIEATRNGYCVVDVDRSRVQLEYWLVPTVTAITQEQTNEVNFVVNSGTPAVQQSLNPATEDRADAPEPAPAPAATA